MRVASSDWWPARMVVSVIFTPMACTPACHSERPRISRVSLADTAERRIPARRSGRCAVAETLRFAQGDN